MRGLPEHALLDRLLRGRVWIPLLGVLLAGIVAMQVSMLKLGASIGRELERGAALQSQNEQLRASVASLSDEQRIERLAAGMGMVMPAPQSIGFLSARLDGGAAQAVANLKAPDSASFLTALQTSGGPNSGNSQDPTSANGTAATTSGPTGTYGGATGTTTGATASTSGTTGTTGSASGTTSAPTATGALSSTGSSPMAGPSPARSIRARSVPIGG